MKTVADIAIEVAGEMERPTISWGDPDLLHEIYDRAVKRGCMKDITASGMGWQTRMFSRVLNCLEGDARFEKYYINAVGGGRTQRETRMRVFEII